MTVKELSDFTGKTERTIRTWISKANIEAVPSEVISQGIPWDYSIDDTEDILNAGSMSKDAVWIIMENARKPVVTITEAPNQMDVLLRFMEHQQNINQEFMKTVLSELKGFKHKPLQIEQPKQDYFSLIGYTSLHHIKTNSSELKKMGMDLRKMAIQTGKELHKIPDERYGQVNSYPVEILDEYFSE